MFASRDFRKNLNLRIEKLQKEIGVELSPIAIQQYVRTEVADDMEAIALGAQKMMVCNTVVGEFISISIRAKTESSILLTVHRKLQKMYVFL